MDCISARDAKGIYRCKKSRVKVNDLSFMVGVSPRSFRDWRNEKTRINLQALEILSNRYKIFPKEDINILLLRWKKLQKKANKQGGIATFQKYGSFFTQEGRRKGGLKAIAILHEKGILKIKEFLQPEYSVNLAEFIGIMLGDGGMTLGQCTITLNGEADSKYIPYVSDMALKLFGEVPKKFKHKHDKAVTIYYSGIKLIEFLRQIGLCVGDKVRQQVDVPEWIKNNQSYKIACLRGLMDTDGGVFRHTYAVSGKKYLYNQVCFTNSSIPLLLFAYNTLLELGFTPKLVANKKV